MLHDCSDSQRSGRIMSGEAFPTVVSDLRIFCVLMGAGRREDSRSKFGDAHEVWFVKLICEGGYCISQVLSNYSWTCTCNQDAAEPRLGRFVVTRFHA